MAERTRRGDRGAVSASGGERGRRPYVQSVRERMVGAGNRRPPRPSPRRGTRARRFPWALVLDTERCDTILALDEAGAIPKRRCVVPNPDAAVCRAARTHGAHAVEATSHAVLVPDGPVHPLLRAAAAAAPPRAPDPIPGLPDACRGAIGCVWLDYCGGVSSRGGRRRREDVRAILAPADAPARGSRLSRCSR